MHNIKYVAQDDIEWTDSMKDQVQHKIVEPLERHMKAKPFELTVHLGLERKRMRARQPAFAVCLVLETFDGSRSEVVRQHSPDFHALVNDLSSVMRSRVRRAGRRRFAMNFRNLVSAGQRPGLQ